MLPIYNRDNSSETTKSESQNLKDQMKGFLGRENLIEMREDTVESTRIEPFLGENRVILDYLI